jgi:para-nitrobenzyl esterase
MFIRKIALVLGLISSLTFSLLAAAADTCSEPVSTQTGLVQGKSSLDPATCAWLGIPYAAPPVGELRWKAPQPLPAWTGARPALDYGPQCVQKPMMGFQDARNLKGMSEDCLYLNVWRPQKSGKFPVMFWIHGGGLMFGSGQGYRADRLAEFGDVVVVTINYRLNIFGFLATPELRAEDPNHSTGNYGSLDQVAALRWVHDNIAEFGGDPANLTIFGESAGGYSVCTLLATPLAKGLFQRAIMESGSCAGSTDLDPSFSAVPAVAAKLDCSGQDLKCLRAVPAQKLLNRGTGSLANAGFPFNTHHDGYFLNATPLSLIRAGKFNAVPFLAGTNHDEADALVFFIPELRKAKPDQYRSILQTKLSLSDSETDKLLALYPLNHFGNQPKKAFGKILSDAAMTCPTYLGLAAVAAQQPGAFYYRFDYNQTRFGKHLGALHSFEIPFVFNQMDWGFNKNLYKRKDLPAARELSKTMMGYWTSFAKTGNPNGSGRPQWPELKPENPQVQVLDLSVRPEPAGIVERCGFWDQYLQSHPQLTETLLKPKEKK